jgi:hypothetical protein
MDGRRVVKHASCSILGMKTRSRNPWLQIASPVQTDLLGTSNEQAKRADIERCCIEGIQAFEQPEDACESKVSSGIGVNSSTEPPQVKAVVNRRPLARAAFFFVDPFCGSASLRLYVRSCMSV